MPLLYYRGPFWHSLDFYSALLYDISDMKKIYIGKSKINGKGLFAGEAIKKGDRIQYINGKKVKNEVKSSKEAAMIINWIGVSRKFYLDTEGTPFRYINHSCDANAAINGTKTVVALRDIPKDGEITIDYSMSDADPFWRGIRCHCDAKHCRKVIRAIYNVPPEVFRKHMPYVSRYFQRVYLRNYIRAKGKLPKKGG